MAQYGRWSGAAMKSDLDKEMEAYVELTDDMEEAYEAAVAEAEDQEWWETILSIAIPVLSFMFFPALGAMGPLAGALTYGALAGAGEFIGHSLYSMSGWEDDLGVDVSSYAPETYASQVTDRVRGDDWGGDIGKWVHGRKGAAAMAKQAQKLSEFVDDAQDYGWDDFGSTMAMSSVNRLVSQGMSGAGKYDVPEGEWTIDPDTGNYLLNGQTATPGTVLPQLDSAGNEITGIGGGNWRPFQSAWDNFTDMFEPDAISKMAYGQGINKYIQVPELTDALGNVVQQSAWKMNPMYMEFLNQFGGNQNNMWNLIAKYSSSPSQP